MFISIFVSNDTGHLFNDPWNKGFSFWPSLFAFINLEVIWVAICTTNKPILCPNYVQINLMSKSHRFFSVWIVWLDVFLCKAPCFHQLKVSYGKFKIVGNAVTIYNKKDRLWPSCCQTDFHYWLNGGISWFLKILIYSLFQNKSELLTMAWLINLVSCQE